MVHVAVIESAAFIFPNADINSIAGLAASVVVVVHGGDLFG
jgi:hypothetical protein